jgi:RimJ/RimL family protein N-acetyltransferase
MIDFGYGIKLGPITEKILPQLFNWRNDPALYKGFRQYRPIMWEEHIAWYRSTIGNDKLRMFLCGHDDKIVGVCGLTSIDRVNSRAEVSAYVGDPLRSELLEPIIRTVAQYGFERENLASIWGEVFDFETTRRKALLAAGFLETGRIPMAYYRDGSFVDSWIYVATRHDLKSMGVSTSNPVKADMAPRPGGDTKHKIVSVRDEIDSTLDNYVD